MLRRKGEVSEVPWHAVAAMTSTLKWQFRFKPPSPTDAMDPVGVVQPGLPTCKQTRLQAAFNDPT